MGLYAGTKRRENDCGGVIPDPDVGVPLTSAEIVSVTDDAGKLRPPPKAAVEAPLLKFQRTGQVLPKFILLFKLEMRPVFIVPAIGVVTNVVDELL